MGKPQAEGMSAMSEETNVWKFSENEKRVLTSVLDEIIPSSDDGKLPGAGELGLAGAIEDALRSEPDLRSFVAQGLADLDDIARSRNGGGFAKLSREDKVQLLNEQAFVLPLTLHAYAAYYQNPRIVEALGLEARPPHPKGYEMKPNDLTLLDAVRQRPRLFRE